MNEVQFLLFENDPLSIKSCYCSSEAVNYNHGKKSNIRLWFIPISLKNYRQQEERYRQMTLDEQTKKEHKRLRDRRLLEQHLGIEVRIEGK